MIYYNICQEVTAFTAGQGDVLPCPVIQSHQTHGCRTAIIRRQGITREELEGIDALVTNLRSCAIGIRTADCIPVLLYDTEHKAAGAIHAGWRGTLAEITLSTLSVMHAEYGTSPERVKAMIGPGICANCFQVGEEVVSAFYDAGFPMNSIYKWNGPEVKGDMSTGHHINLIEANCITLLKAGIHIENIQTVPICTYEDNRLFSARRDGNTCGRNINVIRID